MKKTKPSFINKETIKIIEDALIYAQNIKPWLLFLDGWIHDKHHCDCEICNALLELEKLK